MKFAIVTTCRNESYSFPAWKKDVLDQTRSADEICIVDAMSNDGTTDLLRNWAQEDKRLHIKVEKSTPAQGRNLAVTLSTCDVIVSTDMGCRIDHEWFAEMTKPFEIDPMIDVVAGNYRAQMNTIQTSSAWAAYFIENEYKPNLKNGFLPSNRSVAYKRSAWNQLGGLPEDLSFAADDAVMGLQLNKSGLKISYAEKAIVYWSRYPKMNDYWKEQARYGFGNGEGNIFSNKTIQLVLRGWPKLSVYPLAFLKAFQLSPLYMWKALNHGRIGASFLILPLLIGNKISYNNNFLSGYQRGLEKCKSCRARLA